MSKRIKTNFYNQPWVAGFTDLLDREPEFYKIASGFRTQQEAQVALEKFFEETDANTKKYLRCSVQQDMRAKPFEDWD